MKWPVYGVRLTIHAVNVIRLSLLTVIQRRATWLLFAVATTVYCFQFFFYVNTITYEPLHLA